MANNPTIAICGNSLAIRSEKYVTSKNIKYYAKGGAKFIEKKVFQRENNQIYNQIYNAREDLIVLVEPISIEILNAMNKNKNQRNLRDLGLEIVKEMQEISEVLVRQGKTAMIIRCELKEKNKDNRNLELNNIYDKLKNLENIHIDPEVIPQSNCMDDIHLGKKGERLLAVKIDEWVDNFRRAVVKTGN